MKQSVTEEHPYINRGDGEDAKDDGVRVRVRVNNRAPNSELKKKIQEVDRSGFRIKIVEKSGTRLVRLLQRNGPFKKKNCGDTRQCMVCKGVDGEEG